MQSPHIPDGLELTPFDDNFYHDPYSVYEKLRQLDPIHRDQQTMFQSSWTITDYQTVRSLLSDPRLSVDPRKVGQRLDPRADNPRTMRDPDMMNLDGDEHKRLRALVQQAFTPGSVTAFKTRLEAIAANCLETSQAEFNVVEVLSKPMPTIAIAEFIGFDSQYHADFKAWTDSLTKQGYPMPTEDQWSEIVSADQAMRDCLAHLIEERRSEGKDDLITKLIYASEQEQILSSEEIIDMCFLLVGAGNFTTTDLISNCIYADLGADLGADRGADRGANLQTKSDLSPEALVKTVANQDSPVLAVRRYATEDIVLGHDKTIERGSVVSLVIAAANHDPANTGHSLTFGRGIHHCLGAQLARLEAEVAVTAFRGFYPNARLLNAERSRRLGFRGFKSLNVDAGG